MASLPPFKKCLTQNIRRVNYQVGILKRARDPCPEIPQPTEGHGWCMKGETIEPLRIDAVILPDALVDMLEETLDADEDTDSDSELNYWTFNDLEFSDTSDKD